MKQGFYRRKGTNESDSRRAECFLLSPAPNHLRGRCVFDYRSPAVITSRKITWPDVTSSRMYVAPHEKLGGRRGDERSEYFPGVDSREEERWVLIIVKVFRSTWNMAQLLCWSSRWSEKGFESNDSGGESDRRVADQSGGSQSTGVGGTAAPVKRGVGTMYSGSSLLTLVGGGPE